MATTATIIKINNKLDDRYRLHEGTETFYRDMTSEGYEWLMIRWVGEECHMPHGRIYRVIPFFSFSFIIYNIIYIHINGNFIDELLLCSITMMIMGNFTLPGKRQLLQWRQEG